MKFWMTTVGGVLLITIASTCFVVLSSSTPPPPPVSAAPKTKPSDGKFPKIVVKEADKTADTVPQFHKGQTVFEFTNTGEVPLELTKGKTSCTCAGSTIRRKGEESTVEQMTLTLAPGETGEFVMDWDSKEHLGDRVVSGSMQTNDPFKPEVVFTVKLNVAVEVLSNPESVHFGRIGQGVTSTKSIYFYSELLDNLEILSATTTSDAFHATVKPISPEKLKELNGLSGAEVEVVLDGPLPAGPFVHNLQIETNAPTTKTRVVELAGTVYGPFEVVPSLANFQVIPNSTPQTVEVKVFAHQLKEGDKLTVSKTSPSFISASVQQDAEFPKLWRLQLSVPQGAPAGPIDGTVELKTEQSDSNLTVKVKGLVTNSAQTALSGS